MNPIFWLQKVALNMVIEYWSKIGRIAEENPEMNYSFIRELLIGLEELKYGKVEPYDFG